jgi:hypothetical protein
VKNSLGLTSEDPDFDRDLVNHWTRFGPAALVQKRGRGWMTQFRNQGFPNPVKTKREAMDRATTWCLARARAMRGL